MDVVRNRIRALKGSIDIHSEAGAGTRFTLRLPLTLAISHVLLCRAAGQILAVPLHAVKHTLMAGDAEARQVAAYPTLRAEEEIPLVDVARVLELPGPPPAPPHPVALVEALGGTFGLVFDQLLGKQEIVIKSLGPLLERVPCCAGATLLGDRCALILDVPALVRRAVESPLALAPEAPQPSVPSMLVVDDSDTIREDLRRLLTSAGFIVEEARSGAEALEMCRGRIYDVVSTDITMPGIDGYELCRRLRAIPGYDATPIIMVTSRDQEIDRIRGFDAGVDAYLSKPVDRQRMVKTARRLLETSTAPPAAASSAAPATGDDR
jgi:chemosensory pili system protein ChpA (sensor histidine kinase/response regulator)